MYDHTQFLPFGHMPLCLCCLLVGKWSEWNYGLFPFPLMLQWGTYLLLVRLPIFLIDKHHCIFSQPTKRFLICSMLVGRFGHVGVHGDLPGIRCSVIMQFCALYCLSISLKAVVLPTFEFNYHSFANPNLCDPNSAIRCNPNTKPILTSP